MVFQILSRAVTTSGVASAYEMQEWLAWSRTFSPRRLVEGLRHRGGGLRRREGDTSPLGLE